MLICSCSGLGFVSARNDAMEDRYSVLIRLEDQMSADGFYCSFNGKRFKPNEVLIAKMTCLPVGIIDFVCFTALPFRILILVGLIFSG